MIIIIIFILVLFLITIKIKETFIYGTKQSFKPTLKTINGPTNQISHIPKNQDILKILKNINGYKYYVGGGLINSYYAYGFKPSQISKFIDLNEANFIYNHRTKKYDKFTTINKGKIIPYLSLAIKELNKKIEGNTEIINELQDKMFKLDEKQKKKFTKKHLE